MQWLPGAMASLDQLDDPVQAALDLAAFVLALRAIDATDGPRHNRGRPIRLGDETVRAGIAQLDDSLDTGRAHRSLGTGHRRARP